MQRSLAFGRPRGGRAAGAREASMTLVPWLNDIGRDFTRASSGLGASGSAGALHVSQVPAGGFNLNVATGQDASGAIQTAGDLADAHWTVSNSDNYKNAPIAYTVAPGNVDWYPLFSANGPSSSWIAADPDNVDNGEVTYTLTFNLAGYNPADAALVGGQFLVGDAGTVYLNGHAIGSEAYNQFITFNPLSSGAGDFVAGVNTLVIQTTMSDKFYGAARFEGTVIDNVLSTPGEVHWAQAIDGNFNTAADWDSGAVPGAADEAILNAAGATAYTVTASTNETVKSIQTAATATLTVESVVTATSGTGSGANAGAIVVLGGATLALQGEVDNSGKIALGAGSGAGTLIVGSGGVTLSGGGRVILNRRAYIRGAGTSDTLTNVDNTISGAGRLVLGQMPLVNEAGGIIDGDRQAPLILSTGGGAVANAGLIEATGPGQVVVNGAVDNTGTLEAAGGRVTVHGAVTGSGSAVVGAGTLAFGSSFTQNVGFTGASGALDLAQSQAYGGDVTGFSATGGTSLDLGDIGFVNSGEATFSGTAASGVLTVTDATTGAVAHINLIGDYTGATFTARRDGHGGTIVTASTPAAATTAHRFIAAAASLAGPTGVAIHAGQPWSVREPMLVNPRAMIA
jgi:hypothetical protein